MIRARSQSQHVGHRGQSLLFLYGPVQSKAMTGKIANAHVQAENNNIARFLGSFLTGLSSRRLGLAV